ncbi:glycosyl transferase [Terriglobus roseus DSM 18391]|uniref:Glycosyl transferase n=1 Tax=Terriglobus roseus (strain DSM 18391 / NRRL B-41598 / KBS 63) TaxID=926566 RepID=I3ZJY6_TERRK|nr:glycosyltransferase family 2 protein [Terriglobus roseus]AFL89554.1 glycosyl transferase [Terriglobus roseus DSM 18391]
MNALNEDEQDMTSTTYTERPLLTIAIPTYNRSRYLREFLEALLPQIESANDVELLISDNASPDDTAEMLAEVLPVGGRFRVVRQAENIGSDANFCFCYRQATGKYFWLCGDDDILRPGTMAALLPPLRQAEFDMVYVVPEAFYQDWRTEHQPDPYGRGAEVVTSARLMMLNMHTSMAFITAVIVNRDRVETLMKDPPEAFKGTALLQLSWILPLFQGHRQSLVLWQRFVAARSMNSNFDAAEIFGRSLQKVGRTLLTERPDLARMLTNYTLRQWFPPMLMDMRLHQGANDGYGLPKAEKTLRELFRFNPLFWLFVYPALKVPLGQRGLLARCLMLANQVINFVSEPAEGMHKLRLKRAQQSSSV